MKERAAALARKLESSEFQSVFQMACRGHDHGGPNWSELAALAEEKECGEDHAGQQLAAPPRERSGS